ncbi:MAG: YlmH/Sll1252 family protein [Oscillospiraceae bacterium]|nr:YlmH/Sll1252 family protein [Oscillospiraceae bacterium]
MQPDEDAILRAKLQDAIRLARQGSGAHFIGFLNERQAALAAQETEKMQFKNYLFGGGFCGAERVCFGAFPEWMELSEDAFPIETATATFRTDDHLTHRDFLGALMGTGVQRKVLGDILLESGRCVFFFRQEMADFLLLQLTRIGRVGIKISLGAEKPFPPAHEYRAFSAVIASPRIDCVVAACIGFSRAKSHTLLSKGYIQMNHQLVYAPDAAVREGAVLSVRGKGRFRIDSLSRQTPKGRLRLEGRKFI